MELWLYTGRRTLFPAPATAVVERLPERLCGVLRICWISESGMDDRTGDDTAGIYTRGIPITGLATSMCVALAAAAGVGSNPDVEGR